MTKFNTYESSTSEKSEINSAKSSVILKEDFITEKKDREDPCPLGPTCEIMEIIRRRNKARNKKTRREKRNAGLNRNNAEEIRVVINVMTK